jgi:hypothetical protein
LGRDPLDEQWVVAFSVANGRPPGDADRQDRLFSVMFPGRGPAGAWTDEDWTTYWTVRRSLWSGEAPWPASDEGPGYLRFANHLRCLVTHYGNDEASATRFSRAAGLVWGGIIYQDAPWRALFKAGIGQHSAQLHEGQAGWRAEYVDDDNPAHHWVAAFVAGFSYGELLGALANSARDLAQMVTRLGGTMADIRLGNVAARHGGLLRQASEKQAGLGDPYEALLAAMEQELQDRDRAAPAN